MSVPAYIGLGSNLGDRCATLDAAVAALGRIGGITVAAVSRYHETEPVGGPPGQGLFLNAAAALVTTLSPLGLLRELQNVETLLGRVRTVHWGPRTLDLDLLLFGERVIDSPVLTVPHPHLMGRRFVLEPLAEIAPDAWHPVAGCTIKELLTRLDSPSD